MKLKNIIALFAISFYNNYFAQQTISDIDTLAFRILINKEHYRKVEKLKTAESSRINYYEEDALRMCVVKENAEVEKTVTWIFSNQRIMYTETNWRASESGRQLYQEKTYHDKNGMFAWLSAENTFEDANSQKFKNLDLEINAYTEKLLENAD
jgi:hypothetical protein